MAIRYVDMINGNDANDGLSWANAKLTYASINSLVVAGDEIRFAKSDDPVTIGNALWTNLSKEVVLENTLTKNINDCTTIWTKPAGSQLSATAISTYRKYGTASSQFYFGSTALTADTLQAYLTLPATLDLSAYDQMSLSLYIGGVIPANSLKLVLCSDAYGAVPVDSFTLPEIGAYDYNSNIFMGTVLSKNGGGKLSSGINSIALYTDTTPTTALRYKYIRVNNIIASLLNGFNHTSLISKNGNALGGDEGSYAIQSFNDKIILLDNAPVSLPTSGQGYVGTTETCETFFRKPIQCVSGVEFNSNGNSTNQIVYKGGFDTVTNTQTGITCLCGMNARYYGIYFKTAYLYITISGFSVYQYSIGVYLMVASSSGTGIHLSFQDINNNNSRGLSVKTRRVTIDDIKCINNNGDTTSDWAIEYNSMYFSNDITNLGSVNSNANGVYIQSVELDIFDFSLQNSSFNAMYISPNYGASWKIKPCNIYDLDLSHTTRLFFDINEADGLNIHDIVITRNILYTSIMLIKNSNYVYLKNIKGDLPNTSVIYTERCNHFLYENVGASSNHIRHTIANCAGLILSEQDDLITSDYKDSYSEVGFQNYVLGTQYFFITPYTKIFWQTDYYPEGTTGCIKIEGATSETTYFKKYVIAEIAFDADSLVVITLKFRMDNSYNQDLLKLMVYSNPFYGLSADTIIDLNYNEDWETATISFYPTKKGVLPVCLEGDLRYNLYLGEITVNQS